MGDPIMISSRVLTLLIFTLAWSGFPSRSWCAAPNILVIIADDLGYSDLGCYGGEIDTPNLDRLAANGLRFTQFYNTARCWPTRGALLTGYYAQQIRRDALPGVGGGNGGLRPKWARLLPEFLKSKGYRCYHSGKWHVDGNVLAGGFDRSLNMRNQGNYFSPKGNVIDDVPVQVGGSEKNYYATDATADHAIQCLKDHARQHNQAPFFHYVAFIAPHFPLHAKPEDIAKYAGKYKEGWDSMRERRYARQQNMQITRTKLSKLEPEVGPPYAFPEAIKQLGTGESIRPIPWDELSSEQKSFQAAKMEIHAAMVDRMDREIGRILNQLETMQALENTLILFCSDNGASAEIMVRDGGHDPTAPKGSERSYLCLGPGFSSACNTPHRRHKTWVHEGGISTPLVVHWPARIGAKGELRHTPSHVIDVVPTLLDVAGIQKPSEWNNVVLPVAPGKSLTAAFDSDITIPRDSLWWLHEGNRAIRIADWKLVASKESPWELYDLSVDRSEENNLAARYPERVQEMEKAWKSLSKDFESLAREPTNSR
jgi:arylsulfatase A-like enzyme